MTLLSSYTIFLTDACTWYFFIIFERIIVEFHLPMTNNNIIIDNYYYVMLNNYRKRSGYEIVQKLPLKKILKMASIFISKKK